MTDTAPRVSTVFKDLQRILFLLISFAVIVRLAVKAIGRPSGMNAIPTLTQSTIRVATLIQSGWSFRSHEALEDGQRDSKRRGTSLPNDDDNKNHRKHNTTDNHNESKDFYLKSGQASSRFTGQFGDVTENSLVASGDDNTDCAT